MINFYNNQPKNFFFWLDLVRMQNIHCKVRKLISFSDVKTIASNIQ